MKALWFAQGAIRRLPWLTNVYEGEGLDLMSTIRFASEDDDESHEPQEYASVLLFFNK
jgi:hypothetical protein